MGIVCKGETVGEIGEVDEVGERELVLVVGVRCGKGMRHDTWMTFVSGTQKMCNPEPLQLLSHACSRHEM